MRFSIRIKVILGFLLIIAAMTSIIIGVHFSTNTRIESERTAANQNHEAETAYIRLLIEMRNEEVALHDYLINEKSQSLSVFEQVQNKSEREFISLQKLLTNNPVCLAIVEKSFKPAFHYMNDLATKVKNHNVLQKNQSIIEFENKVNSFFRNRASFSTYLEAEYDKAIVSSKDLTRKAYQTTLFLTLLMALIAGSVGFLIAGSITSPLAILMKGIEKVSKGDFQFIQSVKTNDEVKELVTAFNQMIQAIKTKEADLQSKNEELFNQGQELAAQNEEVLAQQDELEQAIGTLSTQEELLSRLYRFSQNLTQTIDMTNFLQVALTGILDEADAQVGAFFLCDQTAEELQPKAAIGLMEPRNLPVIPIGSGLAGRAAEQKKAVVATYHEGQLKSQSFRGEIIMASEIYLPLIFHDDLLGVISLGRTGKKEFSDEEQKRLASLADQITVALRNSLTHLEIRESLKRIQEVDNLKSELINTVSHELRTPLASILGFTELLLKKPPGEVKSQKYLTTIYNESLRLTGLINNFLDLQRIENGRLEFNKKSIDLEGLIKDIVEVYQGQSNLHTISVDLEKDLPQVVTDPDRITQVVGNLLSNAIKYSPAGGPIEVRAFRRSPHELEVSVRDRGLGIPQDAVQNLFRPFFRVDNSDRRQIGGTGLGLAICQKIIQALGGNIWVRSDHGQGSTFAFALPIVVMPGYYEETSQKQVAVSAEDYILVVEDDPAMANLVCESLNGAGFTTKLTDNGPEALDIVRVRLPIAVILDLILPGSLDGWEVLKHLKMNWRTREVPVIISSCLDQKEHGLELGVADYLVKPFSPAHLINSVTAVTQIASGVIGLTGPDHPDIIKSVEGLLKDKGFTVKEVKGDADLLFVTLNHPTEKEKEVAQNGTDQKLSQ